MSADSAPPLVPLPAAVSAAARPRPPQSPLTPGQGNGPAAAGLPVQPIRRVRVGGVPPPVSAASADTSPEDLLPPPAEPLPAFLGGLSPDQRAARQTLAQLRATFGAALQQLRAQLRNVGELLDVIAANPAAEGIAKSEGTDLKRIKTLHAELLAKTDAGK